MPGRVRKKGAGCVRAGGDAEPAVAADATDEVLGAARGDGDPGARGDHRCRARERGGRATRAELPLPLRQPPQQVNHTVHRAPLPSTRPLCCHHLFPLAARRAASPSPAAAPAGERRGPPGPG
eukprot:274826-Pyramimonas_sp.AAC.1